MLSRTHTHARQRQPNAIKECGYPFALDRKMQVSEWWKFTDCVCVCCVRWVFSKWKSHFFHAGNRAKMRIFDDTIFLVSGAHAHAPIVRCCALAVTIFIAYTQPPIAAGLEHIFIVDFHSLHTRMCFPQHIYEPWRCIFNLTWYQYTHTHSRSLTGKPLAFGMPCVTLVEKLFISSIFLMGSTAHAPSSPSSAFVSAPSRLAFLSDVIVPFLSYGRFAVYFSVS